jgi:hypothetical protein
MMAGLMSFSKLNKKLISMFSTRKEDRIGIRNLEIINYSYLNIRMGMSMGLEDS